MLNGTRDAAGSDTVTPGAGAPDDAFDTDFSAEMFRLLWGQERGFVPSAVDHAYEMIWRRLISSGPQQNQRLSDVTLAAQLGVSRTPVRQALHRLAQDGLVTADPRRGFWARAFSVQDIHEIYDLRGQLEALALRLAAPRLTSADLAAQLEALYAVRALLPNAPVATFMSCDLRLHNLLIHSSGNGRLIRFLATLRSQHGLFQVRDTSYADSMAVALDEHERVLLALIAGQIDRAADLLLAHISHAKQRVLADLFGVVSSQEAVARRP